jgi:hypothetical protein
MTSGGLPSQRGYFVTIGCLKQASITRPER